jgi:hypothetical protein
VTVFYLGILSSIGEHLIYTKSSLSHYTQTYKENTPLPTNEEYTPQMIENTTEQQTPFDSHLTQICNIF